MVETRASKKQRLNSHISKQDIPIIAFKGFDKNFQCRGFQYEVGKVYEMSENPILCKQGFHACYKLIDCNKFYPFHKNKENIFCQVEILGDIVNDSRKIATNKIRIIKRLDLSKELNGNFIDSNGSQFWYKNGELHRDVDQPAIIYNGSQGWYKNGELHRDGDQPAFVWSDGSQQWYQNGKLHRDGDQAAVIWADGNKEWWKNGQRHRDRDQPAVIHPDGTQEWYTNGELNREANQPAIIWSDGRKEWWKNGKFQNGTQTWLEIFQKFRNFEEHIQRQTFFKSQTNKCQLLSVTFHQK